MFSKKQPSPAPDPAAAVATTQPGPNNAKRPSQDSEVSRSLKGFRFPEDPSNPAGGVPDPNQPHIELPPMINIVDVPPSSFKKTPTPGSKRSSKRSSTRTAGVRRKKLKLLPKRGFMKLRSYGKRLKKKMSNGKNKLKSKRPGKGGLKLRVKVEPSEITGAAGVPGVPGG